MKIEPITVRVRASRAKSKSSTRRISDKVNFKKIENVKFCVGCGELYSNGISKCRICDSSEFLEGDIAHQLAGYVKIAKETLLKQYVKSNKTKYKGVDLKLSNKRLTYQLMKLDGFINEDNDDEMYDLIQKIYWRKIINTELLN
jgi:hypothetical protein